MSVLTKEEKEGIDELRKSAPNSVRPVIIHQWINIIDRLDARCEKLEGKLSELLEAADELIDARMDWVNSGYMEFSITHTELDRFDAAVRRAKETKP